MAGDLTQTQLGILRALCRPIAAGDRFATPATNQEIAEEVYLSVDAVKSHLRTLYRKFGIEDLPQNQKRARLVELALGAGLVEAEAEAEEQLGPPAPPPTTNEPTTAPPASRHRRRWLLAAAAAASVAAVVAVLAWAGSFEGSGARTTDVAAYREAVRGYCRLALAGAGGREPRTRVARARDYLEVIETMRGRLASLTRPARSDEALERFRAGLTRAADFTSIVAQGPPPPGSPQEADTVAELTFAAGQVQAGALGYDLGRDCVAIGDLVARSARNAAAP